jgi:hypothetical protein
MNETPVENEALVLDLVEWVAKRPRPYTEVMDAWRTSCPRLPIWEEAVGHRFLAEKREAGNGLMVHVTPAGRAFLRSRQRV